MMGNGATPSGSTRLEKSAHSEKSARPIDSAGSEKNTHSSESAHSGKSVRSGVILWRTIKSVGAQRIFVGYLVLLLVCCGVFCLVEPDTFSGYGDAVWYCFQTITTIGFGDIVPHTALVRAISVVIGLSALFVVALLTGVTVSFFNEKMRLRRNESFIEFDHGMERLTELTPEQLARLEEQYRSFAKRQK